MHVSRTFLAIAASVMLAGAACAALATGRAAADVVALIKGMMAHGSDWQSIEEVKAVAWKPLPPNMLQDCLPDGGCFTRYGAAKIGGQPVTLMVTGARTMTFNFYVKNSGAHVGEAALVDAMTRAGLSPVVARCPIKPDDVQHNSKWWRVKNAGKAAGYVSLTTSCGAKHCEGVGYSSGQDLPGLDPSELSMYSETCGASVAAGKPVSSPLPHQVIAKTIAAAIPASGEAQPYSWDTMRTRLPGFAWTPGKLYPHDEKLAYDDDPNPWSLNSTGMVSLAKRDFSTMATGDAKLARVLRMEEGGSHPRGEEALLLKAFRADGFTVTLARCGKVYTEQKLSWYKLTSAKTQAAFVLIDTGKEGAREHTRYRIYLDGKLPPFRAGEANAGTGRCR